MQNNKLLMCTIHFECRYTNEYVFMHKKNFNYEKFVHYKNLTEFEIIDVKTNMNCLCTVGYMK